MFPLDEMFWPHVVVIAWGLAAIFVARLSFRRWVWGIGLILPIVAVAYWRWLPQDEGQYEGLGDLMLVGGAFALTVACFAVAAALRFLAPGLSALRLAPVLAVIGIVLIGFRLEWQRIPNTACGTQGVQVAIAGQQMYVPLSQDMRIDLLNQQALFYSSALKRKRDVKRVCGLARGGVVPDVGKLWLNVSNRAGLPGKGTCGAGEGESAFCEGFPSVEQGLVTRVLVLQGEDPLQSHYSERFPVPEQGMEVAETDRYVTTSRAGTVSFCTREDRGARLTSCYAWLRIEGGPTLFATGQSTFAQADTAAVSHDGVAAALGWLEAKFTTVP